MDQALEPSSADVCQSCKTDRRSNPKLKLKVSRRCYHRVCTNCLAGVYKSGGKQRCPTPKEFHCSKDMFQNEWRDQTFEDIALEREIDIRRRVFKILDRGEDEFESKRAYDDFLELREEFVMNLSLKTDVAATNSKLKDYQVANGLKVDKDLQDAPDPKTKAPKRKIADATDRSGLVRGLKKIVAPKPVARYDPFKGMPVTADYFTLNNNYDTGYNEYRKNAQILAGGYDFQEAIGESLLRAFAGFGVFIEEEKAQPQPLVPTAQAAAVSAMDDMF